MGAHFWHTQVPDTLRCRTACAAATNLHPDPPLPSLKMMPHHSYFFLLCAWIISRLDSTILTRKHSLDRSSAAFGSCQLLQVALRLQILLSSASTSPAFPSLGYLKAVSGPALCHMNRKVVVGTSSSLGTRSAPISHRHWHHPYPCRPHSPLFPCCAHTHKLSCALV